MKRLIPALCLSLLSLFTVKNALAQQCGIYYVSPTGSGSAYTPGSPGSLSGAISAIGSGSGTIRLEIGAYSLTQLVLHNGYVLDGGYGNGSTGTLWVKTTYTGTASSSNATVITFTPNQEGVSATGSSSNIGILRGITGTSLTSFTLQDIIVSINTTNATTYNNVGVSVYGIYLNGCSGYNINRCYVQSFTAGTGNSGSTGGNASGCGGGGGGGGGNGCGNSCGGCNGGAGAGGAANGSPGGGTGGTGGCDAASQGCNNTGGANNNCGGNNNDWWTCGYNNWYGGNGNGGGNGQTGNTGGSNGQSSTYSIFFSPNTGEAATGGQGGNGGGGGGGGGNAAGTFSCVGCGSENGGTGGQGGTGGSGGTGGWDGGGAFGIYSYNGGSSSTATDNGFGSFTAGGGGSGRGGGSGSGGCGGGQNCNGCIDKTCGGTGGTGGSGGTGGTGGNGASGQAANYKAASGTTPGGNTFTGTNGVPEPSSGNSIQVSYNSYSTPSSTGQIGGTYYYNSGYTNSEIYLQKTTTTSWSSYLTIEQGNGPGQNSGSTSSNNLTVYTTSTGAFTINDGTTNLTGFIRVPNARTLITYPTITTNYCQNSNINANTFTMASVTAGSSDQASWTLWYYNGSTYSQVAAPVVTSGTGCLSNPSLPTFSNTTGGYYIECQHYTPCAGWSIPVYSSEITITAIPVAPTLASANVSGSSVTNGATICQGGTLYVNVNGGSGGASGSDGYEYATCATCNGGSPNWTSTTASNLSSTGINMASATVGTSQVMIQAQRISSSPCSSSNWSTILTLSVVSEPSITGLSINYATVCTGTNEATLTATTSGGTGTPTFTWQSSTNSGMSGPGSAAGTQTGSPSGIQFEPTTTSAVGPLYYETRVSYSGAGCSASAYYPSSGYPSLTVVAQPTITGLSINYATVCTGTNEATLTATTSGGTGAPTFTWQSSTNSSMSGASSAAGTQTGSPSGIQFEPTTTSTVGPLYYEVEVSYNGQGCGTSAYYPTSSYPSLTVVAQPTVTGLSINYATVCTGTNEATLTATTSGGTGAPTFTWQSSTNSSMSGASSAAGTQTGSPSGIQFEPTTTSPVGPLYYEVEVSYNGQGCGTSAYYPTSSYPSLTVVSQPTITGLSINNATVCTGTNEATLTATTSGGTGAPTFTWQSSTNSGMSGAGSAAGTQSGSPSGIQFLPTTTSAVGPLYYEVEVSYNGQGCGTSAYYPSSSYPSLTVVAQPAIASLGINYSTVCTGTNEATLTATTNGGGTGSPTFTWQSSTSSSMTGASGAAGSLSGSPSGIQFLPTTTSAVGPLYYEVKVSYNGPGCNVSAYYPTSSYPSLTVVAQPAVTGLSIDNATVCTGGTATLTATTNGGGTGSPTFTWQQSTSSGMSSPSSAVGSLSGSPSGIQFLPTTSSTEGPIYYEVDVSYNGQGCGTSAYYPSSGYPSMTVVGQPAITGLSINNATVCTGGTSTLTATTNGGGTGLATFTWQQSTNSGMSSPSSAVGSLSGSPSGIQFLPTTTSAEGPIYYEVSVGYNGSGCGTSSYYPTSSYPSMTVVAQPAIASLSIDKATICTGGTATLTATTNGGGTGSPTFTWQQSTSSSMTGASSAAGSLSGSPSGIQFLPTTSSAEGPIYYEVKVGYTGSGCNTSAYYPSSSYPSLTILGQPTLMLTETPTNGIVCSGGNVTLSEALTGGTGTYDYTWSYASSALNGSNPGNNITYTGGTGSVVSPPFTLTVNSSGSTTPTSYSSYSISVTGDNSTGCNATANSIAVTIAPAPTMSTTLGQTPATVCSGTAATINLTGFPTSVSYSYDITYNINGGSPQVATVTPDGSGNASFTTYRALTTSDNGNSLNITQVENHTAQVTSCTLTGSPYASISLSVVAQPTLATPSNLVFCAGGNGQFSSAITGGVSGLTYTATWQYNGSALADNSNPANYITHTPSNGITTGASSPFTLTVTSGTNAAAATYNLYSLVITDPSNNTGCTASTTGSAQVVAVPAITSLSIDNANICTGGEVTLTATSSGGTGTPTYTWQQSVNSDMSEPTSAVGTNGGLTFNPTNTSAEGPIYYQVQVGYSGSGCSTSAFYPGSSFPSLTIASQPSITGLTIDNSTICAGNTVTLTATGSGGTGTPTFTWNQSVNSDMSSATTAAGTQTGTPNGIQFEPTTTSAVGPLYYEVSVSFSGVGCNATGFFPTSSYPSLQVYAQPAITSLSIDNAIVCTGGEATLTATNSGGYGSPTYTWQQSTSSSMTSPVSAVGTNDGLTFLPTTTSAEGPIYYQVQVSYAGTGCNTSAYYPSSAPPSLTVNAQPAITGLSISNSTACTGATITLTSTESGGAGTPTYSWLQSVNSDMSGSTTASGTNNGATFNPTTTSAVGPLYYQVSVSYSGSGCSASSYYPTSSFPNLQVYTLPTISGASQDVTPVCINYNAQIDLTGLVDGSSYTYTYNFNGSGNQTTTVSADGSGNGNFSTYRTLNAGDNGKTLTITAIQNGACTATSFTSGTNTMTLGVSTVNTWTGTTDVYWDHPTNWSCGVCPDVNYDVIIPTTLTSGNFPVVRDQGTYGVAHCKSITISTGASINIQANGLLDANQ